jgi:hypothetical protein
MKVGPRAAVAYRADAPGRSAAVPRPAVVISLKLTFTQRHPTPLYYYRELQNLRDPLHFSDGSTEAPAGKRVTLRAGGRT